MTTKKKSTVFATTLAAAALALAGCGQSGDFDGTWSGDVTATQVGQQGGSATLTVDGGDCSFEMTEATGETNESNCLRDDEEFTIADPLTGKDMEYTAQSNGDTLTLTPDNDDADKVGVMVLTKVGE